MDWFYAMLEKIGVSTIFTILAVVVSPLLAIMVTRTADNAKEERGRKLQIFRALATTRAQSTRWEHLEALNRVPLEFTNKRKEKEVIDAWKAYVGFITDETTPFNYSWDGYIIERDDRFERLLIKMARVVDYEFEKGRVMPQHVSGWGETTEKETAQLRRMLLEVLEGESEQAQTHIRVLGW